VLLTAVFSKNERWITDTYNVWCIRYLDLTILKHLCNRIEILMLVTIIIFVFWHLTLCKN